MASRRLRVTSMLGLLGAALATAGLAAPGASAQGQLIVAFVEGQQPTDASIDELITSVAFDPTPGETGFVQVQVTEEQLEGPPLPVEGAEVTFTLATGEGLASGTLSVTPEITDSEGIATFDEQLSIAEANEPLSTNYRLVPEATPPPSEIFLAEASVAGDQSDPFDIWEDGCRGNGCEVGLRDGRDTYRTTENVGMGASVVGAEEVGITCAGQLLIFSQDIFFHATTGNGPVFLESHITRQEMKASSSNGQEHVQWCVGLKSPDAWEHNGADFTVQNVNGVDLFVGMAPKCPKKTAPSFAPCIVKKRSDGNGGNVTTGWLPGGDPPRRT
jgi:hypothetical protein